MVNIATGDEFGKQICEALGIDLSKGPTRRIVLDIQVNEPIRVYVEMIGTDKLVDIKLPVTGIEVVTNG